VRRLSWWFLVSFMAGQSEGENADVVRTGFLSGGLVKNALLASGLSCLDHLNREWMKRRHRVD
jgi:hypothetical protein